MVCRLISLLVFAENSGSEILDTSIKLDISI